MIIESCGDGSPVGEGDGSSAGHGDGSFGMCQGDGSSACHGDGSFGTSPISSDNVLLKQRDVPKEPSPWHVPKEPSPWPAEEPAPWPAKEPSPWHAVRHTARIRPYAAARNLKFLLVQLYSLKKITKTGTDRLI